MSYITYIYHINIVYMLHIYNNVCIYTYDIYREGDDQYRVGGKDDIKLTKV
jgi:hypothetical protein